MAYTAVSIAGYADGCKNQFVCRLSVSQSVCHTKRVERSTDRNLQPIFTKLATKVQSQEVWLPIVFGGNPKYFYPPNRKWN